MDLSILVYVDKNEQNIEEFRWLYKSAAYSGIFARARIVAVCHPDAIRALPQDDHILIIPSEPYADRNQAWSGYRYINSIANLCEQPVLDACSQSKFVLKTDCDTFVTPALATSYPTGLCFGFGGYAHEESVRRKLSECSARWGLPHAGLHNIGASSFGPSAMVSTFLTAQLDCCNRLLNEEFHTFQGEWPGWCKNVLTMYAGELALRRTYPQQCSVGLLDHLPYASRVLGSDVLHIHAWHTDQYWSKANYRAGQYDHISLDDIDRNTLGGYCHWLAEADIDDVLFCVGRDREVDDVAKR